MLWAPPPDSHPLPDLHLISHHPFPSPAARPPPPGDGGQRPAPVSYRGAASSSVFWQLSSASAICRATVARPASVLNILHLLRFLPLHGPRLGSGLRVGAVVNFDLPAQHALASDNKHPSGVQHGPEEPPVPLAHLLLYGLPAGEQDL